jgi:hypothetical protein
MKPRKPPGSRSSNFSDSERYERARSLGVDALMEKPLDFPLLLKTIAELLAESDADHITRVTNRNFKTALLKVAGS